MLIMMVWRPGDASMLQGVEQAVSDFPSKVALAPPGLLMIVTGWADARPAVVRRVTGVPAATGGFCSGSAGGDPAAGLGLGLASAGSAGAVGAGTGTEGFSVGGAVAWAAAVSVGGAFGWFCAAF